MKQDQFFYAYDYHLFRFLKFKGFDYISTGLNPTTHKQYWQFWQSEQLRAAISQFLQLKKSKAV